MRDYFPRIGGVLLLLAGFILLVTAPTDRFSPLRLYCSLALFTIGFLLAIGLIGTDAIAARLRREGAGGVRSGPLCSVPAEVFLYAPTPARRALAAGIGVVLGALLLFGAAWTYRAVSGSALDRAVVAFPLFLGAAVCGGTLVRWSRMYLETGPQGLTARLYFRTVTIRWEEIIALLVRERELPFLPLETVYAVYSRKTKACFTRNLPGRERLSGIISAATGLSWDRRA